MNNSVGACKFFISVKVYFALPRSFAHNSVCLHKPPPMQTSKHMFCNFYTFICRQIKVKRFNTILCNLVNCCTVFNFRHMHLQKLGCAPIVAPLPTQQAAVNVIPTCEIAFFLQRISNANEGGNKQRKDSAASRRYLLRCYNRPWGCKLFQGSAKRL